MTAPEDACRSIFEGFYKSCIPTGLIHSSSVTFITTVQFLDKTTWGIEPLIVWDRKVQPLCSSMLNGKIGRAIPQTRAKPQINTNLSWFKFHDSFFFLVPDIHTWLSSKSKPHSCYRKHTFICLLSGFFFKLGQRGRNQKFKRKATTRDKVG